MPGHDLHALLETLGRALDLPGPTIVHVRTQKGRGFRPAEADQVGFHGAALPPIAVAGDARPDGARDGDDPADADRVDGRRRRAAGPGRAGTGQASQLHGGLRGRAHRARPDRSPDRRDHRRHADRHGHGEVPGRVPGPHVRRRDRRAARDDAGDRAGDGRHAAGRGALLDVPPAGLRPDRPRRLPERPAGPHRRRPGRVSSARTARATRACSRCRPSASCRTSSSPRRRTSRSCGRCSTRRSRRTTRSRCTTRATPGSGSRRSTPSVIPVGRGEVLREGRDLLFVGLRADRHARARGRRHPRGRGLVGRRHQRPVRASRSTASSSSTRPAASGWS